jgi:osmotically-inducible protein OsmY
MRHSRFVTGLSLAAVFLAAAPAAAQTSGGTTHSDEWATVKIQTALYKDLRFRGRHLTVDTVEGVVTLRGKVDSDEAKATAAELASSVDGVKSVRNELQVVRAAERAEVDARDDKILRVLKDKLKQDPELKDELIEARVDASVVTLLGEVGNKDSSARASELAQAVPGVRSVMNELVYVPLLLMGPAGHSGRRRPGP